MPLSEREQQILQEMERNLVAEDPGKPRRGRLGVLVFLAGIILLFIFFVSQMWFVGLAAFGAMVGGIVLFAGSLRERMGSGFRDLSLGRFFGDLEDKLRDRYRRP